MKTKKHFLREGLLLPLTAKLGQMTNFLVSLRLWKW